MLPFPLLTGSCAHNPITVIVAMAPHELHVQAAAGIRQLRICKVGPVAPRANLLERGRVSQATAMLLCRYLDLLDVSAQWCYAHCLNDLIKYLCSVQHEVLIPNKQVPVKAVVAQMLVAFSPVAPDVLHVCEANLWLTTMEFLRESHRFPEPVGGFEVVKILQLIGMLSNRLQPWQRIADHSKPDGADSLELTQPLWCPLLHNVQVGMLPHAAQTALRTRIEPARSHVRSCHASFIIDLLPKVWRSWIVVIDVEGSRKVLLEKGPQEVGARVVHAKELHVGLFCVHDIHTFLRYHQLRLDRWRWRPVEIVRQDALLMIIIEAEPNFGIILTSWGRPQL
mmetsp:Transcript_34498/g.75294  ORF Transcript_34498/g.75294 Transcript_34498/m.75294 type:complete len:338 (+) Transcript_34498:46-1059(+)